ncbi:FtsX-like permease family protein [Corynebacterium sp.]|uniref:FtsX-like permease family protein n=1 Tax=Corynebacterium sp. TaxID=1720 RepID=UPI0028B20417|nr:FtsX-like permease family protein [Corynebacterium sp.]
MIRAARTLLRLSARGLRAHRARLVLTTLSVVLSTSFLTGTALLSGILGDSVSRLTTSDYSHADIVVRPADGHRELTDTVERRILDNPQVDRVAVDDRRSVVLTRGTDADGPTVDTGGIPVRPTPWYGPERSLDPGEHLVTGSPPRAGELVVTATAAEATGLAVGEEITVTGPAGAFPLRISGMSGGGDPGTFAVAMNERTYRENLAPDGLPGLTLRVTPGAVPEDVVTTLTEDLADLAYPATTADGAPDAAVPSVRTAAEVERSDSTMLDTGLGYLRYILGAFGAIALIVGMFIIANTFAMTVGQRMRDFALIRALGMSGRQVSVSVLCEGAVVGILGSTSGVLLGAGLVTAATRLVTLSGPLAPELPATDAGLLMTAFVLPCVVGTLATVLAAWGPARRAASVPPLAVARTDLAASPAASWPARALTGALVCVTGVVAAGMAVEVGAGSGTRTRMVVCGAGILMTLTGVYLLSPSLARRALPSLGRLLVLPLGRSFRVAGTVAVRTTRQSPRRTAGTAFAVTLALCLVTVTGMTGASTVASLRQTVDTEVSADLVIAAPGGAVDAPVPGATVDEVRGSSGVGTAFPLGKGVALLGDRPEPGLPLVTVSNGDPSAVLDLGEQHGDLEIGTRDGVTMSASYAAANGWSIGDRVPVRAQGQARAVDLELTGTYEHSRILGDVVIGASAFWRVAPGTQGGTGHRVIALLVTGDGSVPQDTLATRLGSVLGDTAAVTVQTPTEFAGEQSVLVERMVLAVYALLALAVVVAVMGVVNTLALSVVERRREIGMLRAVGMSRGQVRHMVVVEALQTTVYGAVLGTGVGLVAGRALLSILSEIGLSTVVVPWPLVGSALAAAVPLGVLAALAPATRAARIPPLEAAQP